jgi:hypothetical protein
MSTCGARTSGDWSGPWTLVDKYGLLQTGHRAARHAPRSDTSERPWLAGGEALVALSAFAGAVGLATGALDLGASLNTRLPFDRPVVGGVALAAVVGAPMSCAVIDAWQGNGRADAMAFSAGTLLVVWIGVEVVVIRSFSWLQPAFLGAGVAIATAGYRGNCR